jgi:hypothetical protein
MNRFLIIFIFIFISVSLCLSTFAQTDNVSPLRGSEIEKSDVNEIAEKVANPLAPITTFLINSRVNFYEDNKNQESNYFLRLQPSVFKPLNGKSAILTRMIFPFIFNNFGDGNSGMGDFNIFPYYVSDFTKKDILGVGVSLSAPTASDKSLGTGKWSSGPSLLFANTSEKFIMGFLLSHLQSVGGDPSRSKVETSTLQPFFTKLLEKGRTISITSETNYSWNIPSDERLSVPLTTGITNLILINKKAVNLGLAGSYFFEGNSTSPKADIRINITYVFR